MQLTDMCLSQSDQIKAVCGEPGDGSTVTLAGVKAMVITNEASNKIKLMTLVTMKNTMINESSPLVIGFSTKGESYGESQFTVCHPGCLLSCLSSCLSVVLSVILSVCLSVSVLLPVFT